MRLQVALAGMTLIVASAAVADEPSGRPTTRTPPSRSVRSGDVAPKCPFELTKQRAAERPPPRSMPDLFSRMGESFARDPSRGFQSFMEELGRLEGPALEGITLTPTQERRTGAATRTEFLRRAAEQGYREVHDAEDLAYLRALVAGLARHMAHRDRYASLDVTLIDAPVADAWSFPGGFLVFTAALLDEPDEATVAGVVAHELAHLDRGHMYELARRDRLASATYSHAPNPNVDGFNKFMTRQMALFGLMMNPFRPEQEHEADCTAATWLYRESYDPVALMGFFERMHARRNDAPDDPFFAFGRSHPYSLARREHVRARVAQLQAWRPRDDLGTFPDNLKRRVSRYTDADGRVGPR